MWPDSYLKVITGVLKVIMEVAIFIQMYKDSSWWVWGELGLERAKQASWQSRANPSSLQTHQKLTHTNSENILMLSMQNYNISVMVIKVGFSTSF